VLLVLFKLSVQSDSESFSNLKIINVKYLMEDSVPGKVDEKATQLHAIASLKVLLDATKPQRGAATSSAANHVKINLKETTLGRPNGNIDATLDSVSGFRCFVVEAFSKPNTACVSWNFIKPVTHSLTIYRIVGTRRR
jgi:hypothetical protein